LQDEPAKAAARYLPTIVVSEHPERKAHVARSTTTDAFLVRHFVSLAMAGRGMQFRVGLSLLFLVGQVGNVAAEPIRWTSYSIPETGTSVDFPTTLFSEPAGRPDGYGQRFKTADGRANLTIQSAPNVDNDSPAAFLAKKKPPAHIRYKRVTSRFFAVSSYKGKDVWYDRCNFSRRFVHCVLINYPAAEEHDWDDIVTRISLSLKG
jgi:hypothetical protein